MRRVIVLQRHLIYCEALRWAVRSVFPAAEVELYQQAEAALAAMRRKRAELVVTGMQTLDLDGLDHIPQISGEALAEKIVIVTARHDERTLAALKQARFDALLDASHDDLEVFCRALREVMRGRRFVSDAFSLLLNRRPPRPATREMLSPHEETILSVLGEGLDNDEAALRLGLAAETVRSHRERIMRKLGLHHKGGLVRYAVQHGYVRLTPDGILHPGFERTLAEMGRGALSVRARTGKTPPRRIIRLLGDAPATAPKAGSLAAVGRRASGF